MTENVYLADEVQVGWSARKQEMRFHYALNESSAFYWSMHIILVTLIGSSVLANQKQRNLLQQQNFSEAIDVIGCMTNVTS